MSYILNLKKYIYIYFLSKYVCVGLILYTGILRILLKLIFPLASNVRGISLKGMWVEKVDSQSAKQ